MKNKELLQVRFWYIKETKQFFVYELMEEEQALMFPHKIYISKKELKVPLPKLNVTFTQG